MSRHHLRKDKICLNCGTDIQEKYCSHCGQENTEPRESFSHLLGHFIADVTHYDSQLLKSIRYLIFRPGFLTREYNEGKRLSYLNPIRMYIFISAVFFLVTFSKKEDNNKVNNATASRQEINVFRQHLADSLRGIAKTGSRSVKDSTRNSIYTGLATRLDTLYGKKNSTEQSLNIFLNNGIFTFEFKSNKYKSVSQYDAAQRALPAGSRDDALNAYIIRKSLTMVSKQGHNGDLIVTKNLEHDMPKIMFVLLPVFALLVGLFYNRKKYYYSQHVIFSLHFHSFMFIALMLDGLINLINFSANPMGQLYAFFIVFAIVLLMIFVYLVAALHKAYQQVVWLSFLKALAISFLYLITIIISLLATLAAVFVFV
jgi:hypothetical protein